jgi:hypothetical protein
MEAICPTQPTLPSAATGSLPTEGIEAALNPFRVRQYNGDPTYVHFPMRSVQTIVRIDPCIVK